MTDVAKIAAGLSKAQRKALPKARLLSVEWVGWRFAGVYQHRLANACRQMVGPVVVMWRMPWLAGSARALHPRLFHGGTDLEKHNG